MLKRHTLWIGLLLAAFVAACSPAEPKDLQFEAPPEMSIDPQAVYLARFVTEKGEVEVELFADKTPITVNNFIFLAEQGYYDNTTFHRVLEDFMAQGGDPTASGSGGPGYNFEDEIHPDLRFNQPGLLAMANRGPNTNGSQFFITTGLAQHLNGAHTIFGKVVSGMEVVESLTLRNPLEEPDFDGDLLRTVEIEELSESRLPPPTETPIPVTPEVESGRPLAELAFEQRENLYSGPPELVIDPEKTYTATIETTQGDIVLNLHADVAPQSVNNFYVLAELGFWDDFPVSFVESGAFVLLGSPAGRPDSDVGYGLPPEVELPNQGGAVGYWYRDDLLASSGSQFYIALSDLAQLDDQFTVFATIEEGLDVASSLSVEDRIVRIQVEES